MRSIHIQIATLMLAAVAAAPVLTSSFESGLIGDVAFRMGMVTREGPPICQAIVADREEAIALVFEGRFKDARELDNDNRDWCLN